MTKETLSEKIFPKGMSNFGNSQLGRLKVEDIKEHTKNAQRRLKRELKKEEPHKGDHNSLIMKMNQIFLEEFGEKLI